MATISGQSVSSPFATGGGGTFFEGHVAAYWLAQLLVGGTPPILINTVVSEVHFQTERLGWQTDDFLVVCEPTGSVAQKIAGQVKASFTLSAADEECRGAISDFWHDYRNANPFSPAQDRLVLVTSRGTNTLLKDFVGLLDAARAARDGAEFEGRISKTGLVSGKAVRYCGALQTIISDIEGRAVSAVDLWPFLRVLHVLSLDLNTSTRQTEAQIRSLLAHTAQGSDPLRTAGETWAALVVEAGEAVPQARSLCRTDLPLQLRERHRAIGTSDHRVLQTLDEHSYPVLRGIRSTIGQDLHLSRSALVGKVLSELETAQVVVVSGAAGSGKSAIAKDAISLLAQDHFTIAFRAEEFAQPHFDATLSAAQIPVNGAALAAILAPQPRTVVLVESIERLLERTTRDAFDDLMATAGERGIRVVLTCRDYSTEQVRASFLQRAGVTHAVVSVPPLSDLELSDVEAALPALSYPLGSPPLRDILRNPYFLDRALGIDWSAERPLPESEREFRIVFWREIVRADHRVLPGMGRRREVAFQQVAIRRARALSAYVTGNDLDPAVIHGLQVDSLLTSSPEHTSLVATAHDVLEDWAILVWIEEVQVTGEGSFKALAAAIGTHPAVRRSYRKWVGELLERDPAAADRLFSAAVAEAEISAQFRDDTLVSLLRARAAPAFLARHELQIVAADRALLNRVIHLLRVACVTSPDWLPRKAANRSIFNVPDGSAWAAVLRLVHRTLPAFTPGERPLLLGLIEDAVRGVSFWTPHCEGEESIAAIGHWLLTGYEDYPFDEQRKRTLAVLAKIPLADPERFATILRGTSTARQRFERNRVTADLRDLLFADIGGMPAARDLPDLVTSVAVVHLLATEDDLPNDSWSRSLELDLHFGVKDGLRHDFFPPSAHRGPWIPLLRHHPRKGIDFFIEVFNHSADWYAHPRVPDPLESAWETELTFGDRTRRKQWANARLWNLYRGTSVGPYVLQCMLMAFEKWLLDFAVQYPKDLDAILVEVLRRSDSAALPAVVASAAIANPHLSGEALLTLLSAPYYIALDRGRMVGERTAASLTGMFSSYRADVFVHEQERNEANALPHRPRDLESAITAIQFGPLAPRVHAVLDQHIAELPPQSEQEENDLVWRLALHRMDIRQYTATEATESDIERIGGEPAMPYLKLQLNAPDSDVQGMIDRSAAEFSEINARLEVFLWGAYAVEQDGRMYDASRWRAMLEAARTMDRRTQHPDGSRDGPGLVAAACLRDYWEDMSNDQREWCIRVVCSEVFWRTNRGERHGKHGGSINGADRAAASVLPMLLQRALTRREVSRVRKAFAAAFTHPSDEVRWSVTNQISAQIWEADRSLALRCVNAIATEAIGIEEVWAAEMKLPYDRRRSVAEVAALVAAMFRKRFWEEDVFPLDAHEHVGDVNWFSVRATTRILAILEHVPRDPITTRAFARASRQLVEWWGSGRPSENKRERDFQAEAAISTLIQAFLMKSTPASAEKVLSPILDAMDNHPREIYTVLEGLSRIEDRVPNTAHFWFLWELFADAVRKAKWTSRLDDERPWGSEMLSAIFLATGWKDEVRHWRSVEGYAHHVHNLFEVLPTSLHVLDRYVRFLYHIGEQSLPDAFLRIARALMRGDADSMLRQGNTVYMLEILLQRHVYGRPLAVRRDPEVRDGILQLLDLLVESGSSAAFRMRDDFVTPLSANG